MKALKFDLSGRNAFFKNPEVNTYCYFSYGHIHKPALLGIFGSILGYKGYEHKYDIFPEYYNKLQNLKVSIIPKSISFKSKIQTYTNTVGYASSEGTLIVKEQWLENPSWRIYVMIKGEESENLADNILNQECVYTQYLGKNDHLAILKNVEMVELEEKNIKDEKIDCLLIKDDFCFNLYNATFRYEEYLPQSLTPRTNHYELKRFILTDATVKNAKVLKDKEKNIVFY